MWVIISAGIVTPNPHRGGSTGSHADFQASLLRWASALGLVLEMSWAGRMGVHKGVAL